ncbi:MAG: transposase, partial [Kiritimatiellia bacterium]
LSRKYIHMYTMNGTPSYLDFTEMICTHKNHLPHWQQGEVYQFVNWHLGDAIAASARRKIHFERRAWLKCHPKPWDAATREEYEVNFGERVQHWLDQGRGECILRQPNVAKIVADSLHFLNGKRYDLDAFVIMPNHVHVLFRPLSGNTLANILKSLKGFTAFKINQELQKEGSVWMEDYWDRMIRSEVHYLQVRNYIRDNPEMAGLREGEFVRWMGDIPVPTKTEKK